MNNDWTRLSFVRLVDLSIKDRNKIRRLFKFEDEESKKGVCVCVCCGSSVC